MDKKTANAFLKASTLENSQDTAQARGEEPPAPERAYPANVKLIPLPEPELLPDKQVNFLELIELRSTIRTYKDANISLKDLSYLLWCTQGVKMGMPGGGTMRTVPSAGARHAFETYLLIQRVEGLPAGLYRFLALEHALLPVDITPEKSEELLQSFKPKNMVQASAVTFIWTAELERMTYKFANRAYRYLFIDAGHVCENLYLAAQTIQMGVCAVGAFYDEKLNAALGVDGENQFSVYAATAGKI